MKRVIHYSQLPPRFPILLGCVLWLMLDRFKPSAYVYGGLWTTYGLICLCWLVDMVNSSTVKLRQSCFEE